MNDVDKRNFAQLLMAVAELHNKKLSQPILDIYWHALKKYSYDAIKQSLNRLIVDTNVGQFMPKPADIVRYIDGDNETKAVVAWDKVMRAIRDHGAWPSIEFDDHIIHAVIMDMGGWVELCKKTTKELDFMFHPFAKRYRAYQYRNIEDFPVKLLGRTEQINRYQHKQEPVETKYIGVQKNSTVSDWSFPELIDIKLRAFDIDFQTSLEELNQ